MWHALALVSLLALQLGGCRSAPASAPTADAPFAWTVGRWSGTRRDGASGREAAMTMRVESALGGKAQVRHLEVGAGADAYRGLAVQTFDPELGRWVRQYVNDSRGRFARYEGELETDRSVWRSATPGRARESRLVSERIGADRWRRTMSVLGTDGEWRALWIDELRRE